MGKTMRLQRVKALEIEQGLDEPHAGRIAIGHGDDIGPEGLADRGVEPCKEKTHTQIKASSVSTQLSKGRHFAAQSIVCCCIVCELTVFFSDFLGFAVATGCFLGRL